METITLTIIKFFSCIPYKLKFNMEIVKVLARVFGLTVAFFIMSRASADNLTKGLTLIAFIVLTILEWPVSRFIFFTDVNLKEKCK